MLIVSISRPLGKASVESVRKRRTIVSGMTSAPLCDLLGTAGRRHPQPLDANLEAAIHSLKHVGKPTRGNVVLVDVELADC